MSNRDDMNRLEDLPGLKQKARHARLLQLVRPGAEMELRGELRAALHLGQNAREAGTELNAGWQERVLDRLQREQTALNAEEYAAQDLFMKLLEVPANRADTLVRNSKKYHSWSLCQLLKQESHRVLFSDPQRGVGLARLALEIAEGPYLRAPTAALMNDLRGSCWTYCANAHRALSEFPEAEEAFVKAEAFLRAGTGDPLDAARLAEWKATLRARQGRPADALRLFEHAYTVYLSVGDEHAAGSALVGKAVVVANEGQTADAARLNRRALSLIDAKKDPRLHNIARKNLAADLKDLGAFTEAQAELTVLKAEYAGSEDAIILNRLRVLDAEISFGLGDINAAIALQTAARATFAEHRMTLDVAVATLDLAAYHLQLNQLAETKRLASESLPLFRSLGIHREAIAAFLVFQEAAEREAATVELVREIATYLRAARTNPELKFRA